MSEKPLSCKHWMCDHAPKPDGFCEVCGPLDLEAECSRLAAAACVHPKGIVAGEHGHPTCPVVYFLHERAKKYRAEAKVRTMVYGPDDETAYSLELDAIVLEIAAEDLEKGRGP